MAAAILGLRGAVAYALIFGVPALEASAFFGFLFPGELAVLLGGVLAFHGRVSLAGAVAAGVGGAIVGDSVGYAIGARYGERLFSTGLGRRLVKPAYRERAEELIRRRGASAVFFGRFTAVFRVLVPGLAGMSGVPYGRFLVFNVLGAVLWGGGFVVLGYAAGNAWRRVADEAARAGWLLAALLLLIGAGVIVARWVARHEETIRAAGRRMVERPSVVAFRRRYNRQLAFVAQRLDPSGVFGLYLTLGLAMTIALGWGLAAAVQDLFAREELVGIDRPIARFLSAHRSSGMSEVMRWVGVLGSAPIVVGITVAAGAAVLLRRRQARAAVYLVATVAGGYVVERGLKLLVHAVRPLRVIVTTAGASFPSGRTVSAITLYGGAAFLISRLSRSWRARVWAWLAAAVIVLLVTTSQVYLGVEPASGVVAAAALGATWLALSSTGWVTWDRLAAKPGHREARNRAARSGLKWLLVAAALVILVHVVLPALPGIERSASALRSANFLLVALALLAELASNAALPQVYRRSLSALGARVSYRRSVPLSMGMFTVGRVLPGGAATAAVWGARWLTRLGIDVAIATGAIVLGGTLGMVVLGAIVFAGAAVSLIGAEVSSVYSLTIGLVLALLAALGITASKAVRSPGLRHSILGRADRVVSKLHLPIDVNAWRSSVDGIAAAISNRRAVLPILGWSALNWLTDVAALWLLFLAFGYRMHIGVLVVGYGLANLLATIPITPGGLGLVEAGLAGIYTSSGAPGSIAVVTVLAYRLISYWLPVLAGVPAYLGAGRAAGPHAAASE